MKTTKVRTQAELNAALEAKAEHLEIYGEWNDVVIPKGASMGSVTIRGSVGYVTIWGSVKGYVTISPDASVGKLVDLRGE